MKSRKILFLLIVSVGLGLSARQAYSHGFGERYDLPIPLNFFLAGAAATVALSFLVIGLVVQQHGKNFNYPRFNLLVADWLGSVLTSHVLHTSIRAISVSLFGLVVATSFFGSNRAIDNLSPIFVWIIWWVGMGYVTALLGNLWMLINPWKITFEWGAKLMGSDSSFPRFGLFRYPKQWDIWPAFILFFTFSWLENVYSGAARPLQLGVLIALYSLITWGGMLVFGKHQWLRRGEAFSVLFGLFALFSPTEVGVIDDGLCSTCELECSPLGTRCVDCFACFERAGQGRQQLNLRPYAVGLANPVIVSTATTAFVLLLLATVTFDGLTATPIWNGIRTASAWLETTFGSNTVGVIDSIGLVLLPLIFMGVYLFFSWAIRQVSGNRVPVSQVARTFVLSLMPIALAYNLAHYLSLLLIQGQLIIPVASDPFGFSWDIFGTTDYRLNIRIINAKFVWFMSVGAIVIGHIIAVYIAHIISLRRISNHSAALRSQYPMLLLMVSFTAVSLWIIAQPMVGNG